MSNSSRDRRPHISLLYTVLLLNFYRYFRISKISSVLNRINFWVMMLHSFIHYLNLGDITSAVHIWLLMMFRMRMTLNAIQFLILYVCINYTTLACIILWLCQIMMLLLPIYCILIIQCTIGQTSFLIRISCIILQKLVKITFFPNFIRKTSIIRSLVIYLLLSFY